LKRRELGWVTIPVLVIFFSVLVYVTGAFPWVESCFTPSSVVQAWEDRHAKVDGVMGIYSPNRTTFNIVTSDKTMLHNMPDTTFGPPNEAEISRMATHLKCLTLIDVGGVYPRLFSQQDRPDS
jgi:hypothetical protein